jgi:hypothetical protein
LDVRFGKFEPRRATVHHHTHTPAVGFTPRRDAKEMAKRVCHSPRLRKNLGRVKLWLRFRAIALYLRFEGLF